MNNAKISIASSLSKSTIKKKRTGLNSRLDVVNKSLLRGIRKFFVWGFKESQLIKKLKGGPKRARLLKEAVSNYLKTLNTHDLISSNESDETLYEYIQILNEIIWGFVCQIKYSKTAKYSNIAISKRVKTFMDTLNMCWKSYSHTLFNELVKVSKR